jgi:aspartyl-tRNA(Asn)/glutamyl-tRNA(Gln) amidotransferase subunit A
MLLDNSLWDLSSMLQTKKISARDLLDESYHTIEKLNDKLHAFITLCSKGEVIKKKEKEKISKSILFSVPFSLKDSYSTKDLRTTAASKVLDDYQPPYNATVYRKLLEVGAVLVGKNNQDAWGHGASTENTDYGIAKNPWDLTRVAGGSSGGSAIAISTRMVGFAIGEDTGGSIRNPASACNICGLKVTYGRVSRYGTIAYASSLDTVGPMAKNVEDLAYILEVIAGIDTMDATSSGQKVEKYPDYLKKDLKGKVIGLPKEFFAEGANKEVINLVLEASKVFESLGAKIVEVSLPYLKYAVSLYYLTALSETSSNLGRYDGIRYGNGRECFTYEAIKRIILGTFALSAGYADELYKKAQKARTKLLEQYTHAFEKCDVLLAPVAPNPPLKIGELINDPIANFLEDLYTGTVNLVGSPSLALPAGFTKTNLPVGMQIIGKKFHEGELLQMGNAYQQKTDWHKKKPKIIENI